MDDYALILANVAKHISLREAEKRYFLSLLVSKTLKPKNYILREREPCNYISFVNSGTLRAYFLNQDGKESTIMFALTDWWVTDMYCFTKEQAAMLNIVAIEKSQIFQLSKENFDKLLKEVPKFERFFRILFQNAYIREQLRVIQNLSLNATERYQNFVAKYPKVIQQVTQKQIASYLGITPEFLSMIRSKKTKV